MKGENAAELGQFIPLHYHYNMLVDESRMAPFESAIAHVVKPGARVLELGGGTGVLSFFAARAGASRVWCVELNPALVSAARATLTANGVDDVVEVIHADAMTYVPPEPVDVVICEMLHVALLREKQVEVLRAFKHRYLEAFGPPLPRFLPEAFIQALQPVEQSWDFHGYVAPFVHFQDGHAFQARTRELGDPVAFQTVAYEQQLPELFGWDGTIVIQKRGELNALRFITKNVLAVLVERRETIDWLNHCMVVPLAEPMPISAGERVGVSFSYRPGAPLEALVPSVGRLP